MRKEESRGFTLIELLVAMVLFSWLAVMGYSGLSNIIKQQTVQQELQQRKEDLERSLLVMARDFYQIVPRTVRNNEGEVTAALAFDDNNNFIEFTRINSSIPFFSEEDALFRQSRFSRIGYKLEGRKLYREHYYALDRSFAAVPSKTLMLDQVDSFDIRFLKSDNTWSKFWSITEKKDALPLAIEVKIKLEGGNEYTHLFPVIEPLL